MKRHMVMQLMFFCYFIKQIVLPSCRFSGELWSVHLQCSPHQGKAKQCKIILFFTSYLPSSSSHWLALWSVCFSACLCLSVRLSVSLPVSVCLSVCLFLQTPFPSSLSYSLSVCLSHSVSHPFCLSLIHFVCLSLSQRFLSLDQFIISPWKREPILSVLCKVRMHVFLSLLLTGSSFGQFQDKKIL